MKQAIQQNQPGPPELSEFRVQEAFWTRFGARLDDLEDWPERKVKDYLAFMGIEAVVQGQQNGGGDNMKADATEKAYQLARQQQQR